MKPHCLTCDKPIAKATVTWSVTDAREAREDTYRQIEGREILDMHAQPAKPHGLVERHGSTLRTLYVDPQQAPRTKADLTRWTNDRVISIRRRADGTISQFGTWDGESYKDRYFHSNSCAEAFGRFVAEQHYQQRLK